MNANTETIEDRVRRVSIASIPRWSNTSLAAWKRGDRSEAISAARHVSQLLNCYGWDTLSVGAVYYREGRGPRGGIFRLDRVGKRGTRYECRLRADGTISKGRSF